MIVTFKQWKCWVDVGRYLFGGSRIELVDAEDGSPVATATSNLDGLTRGCVAIKDYSENEGMLKVLVDAGIVSEPIEFRKQGFVTFPICKLLKGGE